MRAPRHDHHGWTRRGLLGMSGAALGAWWIPVDARAADGPPPPDFPPGIRLYRQAYQNWAGEITVDELWTCVPRTPTDVVTVVNWAHAHGYRIRPRGYRHTWSPLTVTPATTGADQIMLVDTTQYLTAL